MGMADVAVKNSGNKETFSEAELNNTQGLGTDECPNPQLDIIYTTHKYVTYYVGFIVV